MKGQELKFRLVSTDSIAAVNVKVVNIVSEKTAVSNALGEFTMHAKPDEMLVFPSENYEYKRYLVRDEDVKKKVITIVLIPKAVQLDEVVVNKNLNPEDLGLVPKGQKKYTPSERKLYTATSGPVDILANAISGRTKMLKKQVKVERKEGLMEKLRYQFDDSLYIQRLKIPADYVKGFQYYCIDDPEAVKALELKNKVALLQRISQLAPTYIELIAQEEKESQVSGKP
ncbi:hypothetical protein HUK80_12370 [Flavobacterium sp. MAH-1]|uniref:Carboxypeptidase regulatory-like domain-containing protein n=1 Tax=Flavobacterium agri TaxID=2743471 RepID=A0A7Y9C6R7_9FLAO|nr:hypothetical protein [Flavobacterium agri]NUY81695.1 hypothetical protein [Flavobacterium agri]NYA71719.1 hypothetical protein [Flavobacterium agri]